MALLASLGEKVTLLKKFIMFSTTGVKVSRRLISWTSPVIVSSSAGMSNFMQLKAVLLSVWRHAGGPSTMRLTSASISVASSPEQVRKSHTKIALCCYWGNHAGQTYRTAKIARKVAARSISLERYHLAKDILSSVHCREQQSHP